MAFGDGPDDAALQTAWHAFCDRLRDAGDQVFKDHNPADPLQRADGFRFLTQNLGQAFDLALETRNTRYPVLHRFAGPHRKLGSDAADLAYIQAWIDGSSTYRIAGNTGTARFLNFTVQGPRPALLPSGLANLHEPFGDTPEANLFGHEMTVEPDGSFELIIGGPERGPNWLPTTPGTRKLFIRQGFDRWDETPATMSIERLDIAEPRPLPDPAEVIDAIAWAGEFMTGLMRDWPDFMYRFPTTSSGPGNPNVFPKVEMTGADAKRGRAAVNMHWRLAPDEALIIEFEPPESFWMVSNMGAFANSMDYLYRPVSYTPSRATMDGDGKVRLILAHDDPGCHNWLDTQGFAVGNTTFRNLLGGEVALETRVVKRADLAAALPADTAMVTREQRVEQLRARFDGIRRQRYGL